MTFDLATMLAQGATAEALTRAVADMLDADWSEQLTLYGDPGQSEHDRAVAYGKLLGIAPTRALLRSAVDIWDREPTSSTPVVHIVDTR